MKKFGVILLMMVFVVQSFYSATLYIWYQVNQTYITQVFCVNKNRPQLKCNGQCYLAKQMREADEKHPPQQLTEWVSITPCLIEEISLPVQPSMPAAIRVASDTRHFSRDLTSEIFRPPLS